MDNRNTRIGWKIALISLGVIGLSTGLIRRSGLWSSYVLDITAPAWNYMLLRCRYSTTPTFLSFRFSPETALILIVGICLLVETSQFLELYEATFDPWDYVAYVSAVVPVYLVDKFTVSRKS